MHAHLRQCVVCVGVLARLQSMHADEPALALAERLVATFRSIGGNLSRAAPLLRIPRNTLRFRLTQLGLLPLADSPALARPRRSKEDEPGP